jgi:hypothetical protein
MAGIYVSRQLPQDVCKLSLPVAAVAHVDGPGKEYLRKAAVIRNSGRQFVMRLKHMSRTPSEYMNPASLKQKEESAQNVS